MLGMWVVDFFIIFICFLVVKENFFLGLFVIMMCNIFISLDVCLIIFKCFRVSGLNEFGYSFFFIMVFLDI